MFLLAFLISVALWSGGVFLKAEARKTYYVQASIDDTVFLIGGEKFEATTYCFGVEKGDEVMFLSGGPNSYCVSAQFYNFATREVCEVWCES